MARLSILLALIGALLLVAALVPLPAASGPAPTAEVPSGPQKTVTPVPSQAAMGRALFRAKGCVSCHRHDAFDDAASGIGPDLTNYVADPEFLRGWLQDPALVRPRTLMPNLQLSPSEIEALIQFLVANAGEGTGAAPESRTADAQLSSLQVQESRAMDSIPGQSDPAVDPAQSVEACPVTTQAVGLFDPPPPHPALAPYEGKFWYGSDQLWTMLPSDGHWEQLAQGDKMFWWRKGFDGRAELQPDLLVTARRLDGAAPIVEAGSPATNAFNRDIHWAMLVGMQVPTSGCWEFTGNYEGNTLTFVAWVAP